MFFGVRTAGRWFLGMATWGAIAFSTNSAIAQITPDKTLPNNSTVRLDGNTRIIEGGTQAGRNLFHSFQEFSVPNGSTASFNNAANIQNIFSRVTGGSVSNIDGLIKANPTANLFLINPNGIIFGKNASLNIGGSFVATTANAIGFGNQGFFSADNPNNPELLTVNPSAFFFNQIASQPILNQSFFGLEVPEDRSLLLLGGDVRLEEGSFGLRGLIYAPSGRVELGGLAGTGTVGLNVEGNNLHLSFPNGVALADVLLT